MRPPLPREPSDDNILQISQPSEGVQTVSLTESRPEARRERRGDKAFTFHGVFGPKTPQAEVFARAVRISLPS